MNIQDKINAFNLMATLVENVGPADYEDAEKVRLYEMALTLADSMAQELIIERDARELVKKSVRENPEWKSDMARLNKIARKTIREIYAA
jgi:hypothetical protein